MSSESSLSPGLTALESIDNLISSLHQTTSNNLRSDEILAKTHLYQWCEVYGPPNFTPPNLETTYDLLHKSLVSAHPNLKTAPFQRESWFRYIHSIITDEYEGKQRRGGPLLYSYYQSGSLGDSPLNFMRKYDLGPPKSLRDRCVATLLGVMCGDVLGAPIETRNKDELKVYKCKEGIINVIHKLLVFRCVPLSIFFSFFAEKT